MIIDVVTYIIIVALCYDNIISSQSQINNSHLLKTKNMTYSLIGIFSRAIMKPKLTWAKSCFQNSVSKPNVIRVEQNNYIGALPH